MRTIKTKIPRNFMNVDITSKNELTANTNDSAKWDHLKFPLPKGKWHVKFIDNNGYATLIDKRNLIQRLFRL